MEGVGGSTAAAVAGAIALLELCCGPPSSPRAPAAPSTQPESGGAGAIGVGLDLPLSKIGAGTESVADERAKIEQPTTGDAVAALRFTPPPLLDLVGPGMPSAPRNQDRHAEPDMEGVPGSTAADPIDLELHLGPPSASPRAPRFSAQPKSGGAKGAIGLDLVLFTGPTDERGSDCVKSEGPTSSGADAPPTPPLLDVVVGLGMLSMPRNQDSETQSKRVKTELSTTSGGADAAPRLVKPEPLREIRFPLAARRARRSRTRRVYPYPPVAAAHNNRALDPASDPVPAWVRTEVLPRHDLPGDLALHYVGEKVLHQSDMNSRQARFLFPSGASSRFRAFLNADEMAACGFGCTDRKAKKGENGKRAKATPYPGIPVRVYVSGGSAWGMSELRLNKFHRTDGTVINGRGYWRFIGCCGLAVGDGVEVWAFRRPANRLCFLIAKRDDVCPLDCKGRPHF